MTNAEFAKIDKLFLKACENVTMLNGYEKFKPSARQASKWQRKKGIAWKMRKR